MRKKISRKFISLLTTILLALNQLGITPYAWGAPPLEVKIPPAGFQLNLPTDLGTIQNLISGSGPTVIHIQTAHGNYEAQKKIQAILHYLKDAYGFKLLLLEGSTSKLNPKLLKFFPHRMDLNMKMVEELTKEALVKGDELFLLEAPGAEAYGIENVEAYRKNREAFKAVLMQKEKTEGFLRNMDMQIERFIGSYLNKDLRTFLKRLDTFEVKQLPLLDWLSYLRNEAKQRLELDLTDPINQLRWPMLLRIYKLKEFELKLDMTFFAKEREQFLKAVRRIPDTDHQAIKRLLSSPLSQHQLPDPETSLLFERMVYSLPIDFNYDAYPNVKLFIGHLILQSEVKGERLIGEMNRLAEKISGRLAKTEEEKRILALLKDYRLLKRLFALELTPEDYEEILNREERIRPGKVTERFLELNQEGRVKNVKFEHTQEISILFETAIRFYEGTKTRNHWMLENIESRLKETGQTKAIVITGGFHAEPFKHFFESQGYNYALIAPKITTQEGREAYLEAALQNSSNPLKKSTMDLPRRMEPLNVQISLGENLDWINERIGIIQKRILGLAKELVQKGPPVTSLARSEVRSVAESGTLKLSFGNSLSETVTAEHGITQEELKQITPQLEKIHQDLKKKIVQGKQPSLNAFRELREVDFEAMQRLALKWKDESDDIVILGGTVSGAEMIFRALVHERWNVLTKEERGGYPRIHFVNPDQVANVFLYLRLGRTRVVIITDVLEQDPFLESGYQEVKQRLVEGVGRERMPSQITMVGDLSKGGALSSEGSAEKFAIPSGLSIQDAFFTTAGLLPLILAGKGDDAKALLDGAREAQGKIDSLDQEVSTPDSPAVLKHSEYLLPGLVSLFYQNKHKEISIFHVFSEKLRRFGTWRANRLNHLMGAAHVSLVFRGAVGTRHNHAELQDWQKGANHFQVITLGVEKFSNSTPAGPTSWPLFAGVPLEELLNASRDGTEEGLAHGKRPNMNLSLPRLNAKNLGTLIYSSLYEDVVLQSLLTRPSEVGVETQNFVKSLREGKVKAPRPAALHHIEDASGIGFGYSLPTGEAGPSETERREIADDLVKIMQEVAQERLSDKHDYLNLPGRMIQRVQSEKFREVMNRLKKDKTKFIVIGIGGSSQGAKMELANLGLPTENIIFLEGIDPDFTEELLKDVDLTKTGVLVISKSGETLESNVLLSVVKGKMEQAFHARGRTWEPKDYIVAVTDPALGILRKEAERFGYGLLEVPSLVDGRFSVLSDVGISALSLVIPEADLLDFLRGAQDYVGRTELDLTKLKHLRDLEKKKEKTETENAEIAQLKSQIEEELREKSATALGYQYGGWSAFFNFARQKSIWLDIALSSHLGEMIEEMIQLWNESIGKPAVDTEGRNILYYRRGFVAPSELLLNLPNVLTHPNQAVTLWNLRRDDDSTQDRLQRSAGQTLRTVLGETKTPVFGFDISRTPRTLGALTVMKQQSVMVHSKTKLLGKPMDYSGQPGVELAKRYARKKIQNKKGVSIDVIPHELAPFGDLVRSVGLLISNTIANISFETPRSREEAVARLIRQTIKEYQGPASIKNVWMRGEVEPRQINKNGTRTLVVVPLDESRVMDMNNGTIGTLFSVYEGGELAPNKLLATFVLLHGPTTVMIARVVPGGEPQVYDFIWNEETHEFVQKQHAGRETSLIEMGYKGDELAIYGKVKDWPDFLKEFYYAEIMRSGKKVRISESVADLYEMLLKGGIIAAPLTDVEAVMWASVMEGAGGRSLVMTSNGPQSALTLNLGSESFKPGKRHWAFFGNREAMDRLEGFMKKSRVQPEYRPAAWRKQIRQENDNKPLNEALAEMGEDPETIQILLNAAKTVTRKIRPMFSTMGIEEGGGEVNLAGDEQVGADIFTNVSFRNALLNPGGDPALEGELIQAELRGERVSQEKLQKALVSAYFSEEEDRGYPANLGAKFFIIFDPLDGSSKVDTNGGVSSIGGIWKSTRGANEPFPEALKEGADPVFTTYLRGRKPRQALYGAFFFLYGPQTLLYYTSEKTQKVYVFRLNQETGEFARIGVLNELPEGPPRRGLRLAIGGERPDMVPPGLHPLLTEFEQKYSGRAAYSGSLNVDFVGVLNGNDPAADGGAYAYPGTQRRPDGRLRLDSELSPLSYIIEKIGGRASNGKQNILDISVGKLHQHEPFFIGTKWVIEQIENLFPRSEVRVEIPRQIGAADVSRQSQSVVDFLKAFIGKDAGAPLTVEDIETIKARYYEPAFAKERQAFNRRVLALLYRDFNLGITVAQKEKEHPYRIYSIDGPSILDVDIRFEQAPEHGGLQISHAQIKRGNTGAVASPLIASYGEKVRFFGLIAKGDRGGELFRQLSEAEAEIYGESTLFNGDSRTSLFLSEKGEKNPVHLRPFPPPVNYSAARMFLRRIRQHFPPADKEELVILGGQIFGYGQQAPSFYTRLIRMLEGRGYRTIVDFKPYQSSLEINAALAAHPFMVKPNLEEFSQFVGRDKEELKRNPRLTAQLATELAVLHRIPLFVVSMEEQGAVAVYLTKEGWKAIHTVAPPIQEGKAIAAGDAVIGGMSVILSRIASRDLTDAVIREALQRGVAAGTLTVSKPFTEVATKEEIEQFLSQIKIRDIDISRFFRHGEEKKLKHPPYKTQLIKDVILGIAQKNPGIWSSLPPETQQDIAKWLGWFDAPIRYSALESFSQVETLRQEIEVEGFKHVVLIGTGGSALGADTLYKVLPRKAGSPDLIILDLTHPKAIQRVQAHIQDELDKEKMRQALRGEVVDLDLKPLEDFGIFPKEREEVFTTWGYTNVTGQKEVSSLVRGEYLIDETNQRITIKFLPGTHPHSFFGMTKDGRILVGAVPGATHFRGTTLEDLASNLINQGAQDVFLWANGKDTLMQTGTEEIVEAEGSRRMGLEAIIIDKTKPVAIPPVRAEVRVGWGADQPPLIRSEVKRLMTLRGQKLLGLRAGTIYPDLGDNMLQIFGERRAEAILGRLIGVRPAYAAGSESSVFASVPTLSREELSSLGVLRSIVTNSASTERRIFDYRKANNPQELDPWILKTLHDPKIEYKLFYVGTPEAVNRFRLELRQYAQSRYHTDLPLDFQVVGVDSPELLMPTLQKLISEKNTPVGIVSAEREVLERVGYRGRLTMLRALGDPSSPEVQNATGLLTEAWLLKENLPLEMRIRIQTGKDLDLNHQWDDLLAALHARATLLVAA